MATKRRTVVLRLIGSCVCLFLDRTGGAAAATAGTVSPETLRWFQTTEQALMDALAPGDKAVWDRIMDRRA